MRNEKFAFTVNNFDYILWIWRGNYLNLGAGAEMGLYYRPTILPSDPDGLDHYFAHSELALPMQLYLYDYESGENIFSWEPTEDQWWICSFNPNVKYEDNRVENQIMICSVGLSKNTKMYDGFVKDIAINQPDLLEYVILDDTHYTIWFMWGDKK